jgi:asparagine synthase (glutamine-hydrolysing)
MKFFGYLYFRNAPSAEEFQKKQLKEYKSYLQQIYFVQINQLCHKVLVPFLDKDFLDVVMRINPRKNSLKHTIIKKIHT